jgi:hypothetical protein
MLTFGPSTIKHPPAAPSQALVHLAPKGHQSTQGKVRLGAEEAAPALVEKSIGSSLSPLAQQIFSFNMTNGFDTVTDWA